MPIIKSAKKRVKVASKARSRNIHTRRAMRSALKDFAKALEGGKPAEISKAQTAAVSALDIASKKAVIHKNKAARFKARLAQQAKKAGAKPAKSNMQEGKSSKVAPKKTTAKKPIVKKAATKSATSVKK